MDHGGVTLGNIFSPWFLPLSLLSFPNCREVSSFAPSFSSITIFLLWSHMTRDWLLSNREPSKPSPPLNCVSRIWSQQWESWLIQGLPARDATLLEDYQSIHSSLYFFVIRFDLTQYGSWLNNFRNAIVFFSLMLELEVFRAGKEVWSGEEWGQGGIHKHGTNPPRMDGKLCPSLTTSAFNTGCPKEAGAFVTELDTHLAQQS